jgi:hypothetical protein
VEQTPERIALWHEFLRDADGNRAMQKLRQHIQTEKFPPAISDIASVIDDQRKVEKQNREEWLRLHGDAEPLKQLGGG